MKIEPRGDYTSEYSMADPVIHCSTNFIEILDTNSSSVHCIRLESIMHVRSSYTHVFIGTNTLNSAIAFSFKDTKKVGPFVKDIMRALTAEQDLVERLDELKKIEEDLLKRSKALDNPFRMIEQDNLTLSEKFDSFKDPPSVKQNSLIFPVAHVSAACEAFLMFVTTFLICIFALSFATRYR